MKEQPPINWPETWRAQHEHAFSKAHDQDPKK